MRPQKINEVFAYAKNAVDRERSNDVGLSTERCCALADANTLQKKAAFFAAFFGADDGSRTRTFRISLRDRCGLRPRRKSSLYDLAGLRPLRRFQRLSVGPTPRPKQTTPVWVSFALERMMGVGPTSQAWEARILPMYYTRKYMPRIDAAVFFIKRL